MLDESTLRTRKPMSGHFTGWLHRFSPISFSELENKSISFCFSDLRFSSYSAATFFPTRRMRSLLISAMVLYPALKASDCSGHGSGSCTAMNFRLPPSFALSCSIACTKEHDPAKKSITMKFLDISSLTTKEMKYSINRDGFGKPNTALLKSSLISFVPS